MPLTRLTPGYPRRILNALGDDAPGCLWARGDLSLLENPGIALVGSRELHPENAQFAREVGTQAAKQGCTLISGNARGADRTAQDAALAAGGGVISIVADRLTDHVPGKGILYLSEEGYDLEFSSQRALSRNRCIHALGLSAIAAQCSMQTGGTWDGSVKNLRFGWSELFCYDDASPAVKVLQQMGANSVGIHALRELDCIASVVRSRRIFKPSPPPPKSSCKKSRTFVRDFFFRLSFVLHRSGRGSAPPGRGRRSGWGSG